MNLVDVNYHIFTLLHTVLTVQCTHILSRGLQLLQVRVSVCINLPVRQFKCTVYSVQGTRMQIFMQVLNQSMLEIFMLHSPSHYNKN